MSSKAFPSNSLLNWIRSSTWVFLWDSRMEEMVSQIRISSSNEGAELKDSGLTAPLKFHSYPMVLRYGSGLCCLHGAEMSFLCRVELVLLQIKRNQLRGFT
ncbi:hypothetical protein XENOCAPTIV_019207 [Xenoophorus captivus]|uniref:Uncharacterized protein n=1 Tax=Xenoophorus captivus TaxID=1517983 RepID=A0ABV0RIK9_9TELE